VGPGSVAGFGRRVAALVVDWLIADLVVVFSRGPQALDPTDGASWLPLVTWLVISALCTGLAGASPGKWLLRLRVIRLDGRPLGLWRSLVRTCLIALVVPPLVMDHDTRGLHDLAAGTVVVRGPR
jgi:uncharacterized RDD family membrane protein YckC